MTNTKNKVQHKKNSNGAKGFLMIFLSVMALIAVGCGLFYANDRSKKDVLDVKPSDTNKQINYLDESIEAQRIVDNILLSKNNWQLIENVNKEREVQVEDSAAKVKVKQRELVVGIPDSTSVTGAGAWLKEKVEKAGLAYIDGEMVKYKGWDAFEAQIGLKIKAGDGFRTVRTDSITFYHNSNLTKKDKDIKDLPEKTDTEKDVPKYTGKKYSGKLAILIDDCGYDKAPVQKLLNTGLPFSYAILPNKAYSSEVLEMVVDYGRVPMLHLPMEPMDASQMSEGNATIRVSQTAQEKKALFERHLKGLRGVYGVNNHQGSRATSDEATMRTVLEVAKRQGVFFIDSNTTGKSVAKATALKMGVPTAKNDIFLDNSSNIEDIRAQIYKAMERAEKQGSAIAICHARKNTAECWKKYASEFKQSGITFVSVDMLLQ